MGANRRSGSPNTCRLLASGAAIGLECHRRNEIPRETCVTRALRYRSLSLRCREAPLRADRLADCAQVYRSKAIQSWQIRRTRAMRSTALRSVGRDGWTHGNARRTQPWRLHPHSDGTGYQPARRGSMMGCGKPFAKSQGNGTRVGSRVLPYNGPVCAFRVDESRHVRAGFARGWNVDQLLVVQPLTHAIGVRPRSSTAPPTGPRRWQ
jgi:hypothetical protein